MSFKETNDPRSSEISNSQIQLSELVTYEERTPDNVKSVIDILKNFVLFQIIM